MDVFEYYMKEARRSLDSAEHMRSVSYPLAEDPKIFLGVIKKLHECHKTVLSLLLIAGESCSSTSECNHLPLNDFSKAFELAGKTATSKGILEQEELSCIKDTFGFISKHDESPVEFPKDEKFVMCDDTYGTSQLSGQQVEQLAMTTKNILRKLFMNRDVFLAGVKGRVESVADKAETV